jgi:hypothetical protein
MKSQIFDKEYIYPKCWDDDDICRFKYYLGQSKIMFPNLDEYLQTLAIEHHINVEKGLVEEINKDNARDVKHDVPYFEELKTETEIEVNS